MSLQTQDPVLETNPETLAALSGGNTLTLTPSYPGTYELVLAPGYDGQIFDWTLVTKPRIGEAVVQLGTAIPNPFWARARAGFKLYYPARANGPHDITIDVSPGPITRKNGAQVAAVAWVQGVGGTYRSVPVHSWRRTRITIPSVEMRAFHVYTIVFAGDVFLPVPNQGNDYGEFIGTFPKVEIETPYRGLIDEEVEVQARFEQAIAEYESLDQMCSALAEDDSVALAHSREVNDEEIAARGDAGFVTSSKNGG